MVPEMGDLIPAVQRYLIAWQVREHAGREVTRAQSTMLANEYETRQAIWHAPDRFIEAELLGGQRFKVCLAPNGRDLMVLPL